MYSLVVSLISPLLYQYDEIRFLEGECPHRTRFTILLYCSHGSCNWSQQMLLTTLARDSKPVVVVVLFLLSRVLMLS